MQRLGRILRRLLLVCLSLLVMAGLIEVGLRLFTELGVQLLVKDELVGQRYRQGHEGEVFVPEAGRRVHLRFHRDGYRGPDRPQAKPQGVRRVVVLGDSSIAAIAVAEDDTLVRRLEQLLGDGWQVFNFGVSGYSTGQSLLTWRHFARAYEPDVVLLGFTISNDVTDNCRCTSSAHRPYFDLNEAGALELATPMNVGRVKTSRLLSHSRLYVWQKTLFKRARHGIAGAAGHLPAGRDFMRADPPQDFRHAWKITQALLPALRDEVEATGAKFAMFSVSSSGQYSAVDWKRWMDTVGEQAAREYDPDRPDRRITEVAKRYGIRWKSLLPAFREARRQEVLNFPQGHWNEAGNRVAAREVHRWMVASGLVD